MQYATAQKRAIALLIDILLALIWFVAPISLGIVLYQNFDIELPRLLPLILLLCIPVYFIYLPYKTGQTLGAKIMKIKIVNTSGNLISLPQSIIRYLITITLSSALLCLGFLWILINKKKQAWHDMIAKTLVIKAN